MVDHGNGYKTLYAHLSKIAVVVGQTVKRGDSLGMMGSTGRSTGTHLHFEIRTGKGNADPVSALK
jgi:murein DD-endopeptidase MepM/ murein hydrolase activator NlpD